MDRCQYTSHRGQCANPAVALHLHEDGNVHARCTRHAFAYILDGGATVGIIETVWLDGIPRSIKTRMDRAPMVRLAWSLTSTFYIPGVSRRPVA